MTDENITITKYNEDGLLEVIANQMTDEDGNPDNLEYGIFLKGTQAAGNKIYGTGFTRVETKNACSPAYYTKTPLNNEDLVNRLAVDGTQDTTVYLAYVFDSGLDKVAIRSVSLTGLDGTDLTDILTDADVTEGLVDTNPYNEENAHNAIFGHSFTIPRAALTKSAVLRVVLKGTAYEYDETGEERELKTNEDGTPKVRDTWENEALLFLAYSHPTHSYGAWTKQDDSYHVRTCLAGDDTQTQEHTWDAGVVTTAATEAAEGVTTYTCTVCGATKTEAIAKLTPASKTDASTTTEKATKKANTPHLVDEALSFHSRFLKTGDMHK